MKNIFKYIFISFGLLFLASFFFVDKTYGIEPCDCPCGCNYSGGFVVSCKTCTCTNYCACGHLTGYPSCLCKTCPPPEPTICPASVYNAMVAECNSLGYCGALRDCSSCISCNCECGTASDGSCNPVYDISACGLVGGYICTGECRDPNFESDCSRYDCPEDYTGVWEPSLDSCICQRSPLALDSPDCLYPCSDGTCCPAGTYCGDTVAGYTICVDPDSGGTGGTGGGDSVYTCYESDTICDPTQYCDDNGWTTTPTPYLLEDIVSCISRINCEDVKTYGNCYEDPSINNNPDDPATGTLNDIQTLKVTMGDSESEWVEQKTKTSLLEKIKDFFRTLSMLMY